jgi:hypothetical protein
LITHATNQSLDLTGEARRIGSQNSAHSLGPMHVLRADETFSNWHGGYRFRIKILLLQSEPKEEIDKKSERKKKEKT